MARPSVSYRISLVVVIPLLIVVTGAIIAGNAYFTTWRTIEDLTRKLLDQVSAEAVGRARAHLRQAEPAVELVASTLATAELPDDITGDDALAHQLVSVLRANPSFEWVTYGDEHGGFVGVTQRHGKLRVNRSRVVGDHTEVTEHDVDADDAFTLAKRDTNHYDPRTRPYYQRARARRCGGCGRRRTSSSTRACRASPAPSRCTAGTARCAAWSPSTSTSRSCRASCASSRCRRPRACSSTTTPARSSRIRR